MQTRYRDNSTPAPTRPTPRPLRPVNPYTALLEEANRLRGTLCEDAMVDILEDRPYTNSVRALYDACIRTAMHCRTILGADLPQSEVQA